MTYRWDELTDEQRTLLDPPLMIDAGVVKIFDDANVAAVFSALKSERIKPALPVEVDNVSHLTHLSVNKVIETIEKLRARKFLSYETEDGERFTITFAWEA